MSSKKVPSPSSGYYLSPEECQARWGSFTSQSWKVNIPDSHKKILQERFADYCKNGVYMTPFEEFEKELFEMLKEG